MITRHSTIEFCICLVEHLKSWRTKKQNTIFKSSYEVEYHALASTYCKIQLLVYLLEDLCIISYNIANLFYDSKSARHITHTNNFHKRTWLTYGYRKVLETSFKSHFYKLLKTTYKHVYQAFGLFHKFVSALRVLNVNTQTFCVLLTSTLCILLFFLCVWVFISQSIMFESLLFLYVY